MDELVQLGPDRVSARRQQLGHEQHRQNLAGIALEMFVSGPVVAALVGR